MYTVIILFLSIISRLLPSAVAINNTIVVSPGERGATTASACVVVIGRVVGVVVIGRVARHVVIGRVAGHVVVGGIVVVVVGRIVAVVAPSTKEESRVFILC